MPDLVPSSIFPDIADAIREKYGDETTYKPREMANAIRNIPSGGTTIVYIPTVTVGQYTYNGTEQGPTISEYDPAQILVTNAKKINAGTYTLTLTLRNTNSMIWSDLTTTDKTFVYTIAKATPTLTVAPTSVTLNASGRSATATLTYNGDGTVSATTSDSTVATATLSGNTITIASVDDTTGTATITVSATEGTNYLAASGTIAVTAQFVTIYGASWDGTSTTAWTRTDAAAGFADPVPYVSGATNYGSPFDNIMPWAGMVVSERTGGTMVSIPKFWYKLEQNGNGMSIQIADGYVEGFSVSPAHMDRGDGNGERDVVYIGRYHCDSDYKSTTNVKPKVNLIRSTARTGIHNLGSNIWQCDFAMRFTLWLLNLVEFADWNSQAKIGYGYGASSSSGNVGYTDSMPYHTGTTKNSRTTYGLGMQYRNIEGLWDNVYDWMDGCYNNSSGLNLILNPSNFSDSSGGTAVGTPSNGYPSAFSVKNVSGTFSAFIPTAASGSDSTYSCDNWNFDAAEPSLYVGGYFSGSQDQGLFYVACVSTSHSSARIGCRLQELP